MRSNWTLVCVAVVCACCLIGSAEVIDGGLNTAAAPSADETPVLQRLGEMPLALTRNGGRRASTVAVRDVSAEPIVNASAGPSRNVPGTFCDGEWQSGYAYAIDGWFTSNEAYAAYQDPCRGLPNSFGDCEVPCGSPPECPFDVTAINWIVWLHDSATYNIQPLVYAADLSDPLCPLPGSISCAGPLYSVTFPASGVHLLDLPFTTECNQSGPYFAAVYVPPFEGPSSLEIVTDDGGVFGGIGPDTCRTYNDAGAGFGDLVDDLGFVANLELYSEGYTPAEDTCYADGDVDGNGIGLSVNDLIYLVDFVIGSGAPPVPLHQGDLNGDGYIDQGDIEVYECYLFHAGLPCFGPVFPVPVTCCPDTVRGACCAFDTCHVRSPENCEALFGMYLGDGTRCETTTCPTCPDNLLQNGGFIDGAVQGYMPSPGQVANWGAAYGQPYVVADSGCEDFSYVRLDGNSDAGSAIYQQLDSPIQAEQVYELSLCVRVSASSSVDYVKLRAVAFNSSLPSGGAHPPPTSSVAIMDISGMITADEWTTYTFHRWPAHYDFNSIAIAVVSNDTDSLSIADIDNICLIEADSLPCYLVEMDSQGNIIYPDSLDPDNPPIEEDVEIFMGNINDLYAPCFPNGMDIWYENCPDSCASIGGTIPDEILEFNLQDSLNELLGTSAYSVEEILDSMLQVEDRLKANAGNLLDTLFSLGALPICDSLPPKGPPPDDATSPFMGRDIVFVHGFKALSLIDKMEYVPKSDTKWPDDRGEFYDDGDGGYWKDNAEASWDEHIKKYLHVDAKGNSVDGLSNTYANRFIVVCHPATQSGIRAVHAIQEQILEAMFNDRDVRRCGAADQAATFGHNGFVIISHSAGALFTNVAMKMSALTGANPLLGLMLGDASIIAERCDLHIALQGGIMGSNYGSVALLALSFDPVLLSTLTAIFGTCDPTAHPWLFHSQLLDMAMANYIYAGRLFTNLCYTQPHPFNVPYCQLASENLIEPPMCVLTVAGGHPSEYGIIGGPDSSHSKLARVVAKQIISHGFDDGVLASSCECGNTDKRIHYPNRYLARPGRLTWLATGTLGPYAGLLNERVYDMGITKQRAIGFYLDQKLDLLMSEFMLDVLSPTEQPTWWSIGKHWRLQMASAGCLPWLSPTGMRQPVLVPGLDGAKGYDALKRLNNHYSFLQSPADHYSGVWDVGPTRPYVPNYYKTYGERNWEEVRVITSPDVYTNCGVSGAMKNQQVEYVHGKKITWTIKFFRKRWTFTWWIWKRTYHRLAGSSGKNQLDYVYDYVLKP